VKATSLVFNSSNPPEHRIHPYGLRRNQHHHQGGYAAEMDRINHYLKGASLKLLKIVGNDGKSELIDRPVKKLPGA